MILIFLIFFPLASEARETCTASGLLLSSAKLCEDNHLYEAAAEHCLRIFESKVKAQKALTDSSLLRQNRDGLDAGKSRQAQNFSTTNADYDTAQRDFQFLLSEAKATRAFLDSYRDGVIYPSDWQTYAGNREDLLRILWAQPCYAKTAGSVDRALSKLAEMQRDLARADGESKRLNSLAGDRGSNLGGEEIVKGSPGLGAPAMGKQKPASRSTVTGKIEKEKP